jgi:hypothetical protein
MSDTPNFRIEWAVREWWDRVDNDWRLIDNNWTRESAEKYVQRNAGDPDWDLEVICRRVYGWHRPDEEEPQ